MFRGQFLIKKFVVIIATGLVLSAHLKAEEKMVQAKNPVIWADVPDISIVRVNDSYYMSSTTMHMSPGLPIMKSKDLVNWKLISYVYDTLIDNDAMNLNNNKSTYGAGSWASSIRFHDGLFYVSTFSSTSGMTHVYTTKDPENEPWKEKSFKPSLHDHSLVFDDEKVYMIHGGGNLRLTELNPDFSGIKQGGFNDVIVQNAHSVAGERIGLPAEGSQMWKVNGKYYLFNITWPRNDMRTEIVHRADQLTGPYEGKVILKDQGIAQGGIVDAPDGKWWAYMFQDHGAVGRIPFIIPMKWENDWPVIGVDGKVPETLDIPAKNIGVEGIVASDEFDRKPGERALPLAWQWNHNPVNSHWSLTDRPGFMRITTSRIDQNFLQARNSLTQRTFGPESSGVISIDLSHMKDGDIAGLGVLQKRYGLVGVKKNGNDKSIVMISAQSESPVEIQAIPVEQNTLLLRIDCDFKNKTDKAYFYYSLDGTEWKPIGNTLQMAYTLPHFMGYRFTLFNYATKEAGGYVDFDYFRIGDKLLSSK